MKKIVLSLAVLATVALASCSNGAAKNDSNCDSNCAAQCEDTNAPAADVDTNAAAPEVDTNTVKA